MNQRPTLLKPVGPASLAGEHEFQLGGMQVRPALRQVEMDGARDILEPRVMQVLVELARANGAVVSRDDLIRECWGGRIVGDDAINRCVSKVRQIAELGGGKPFEIETIPRVGYRLIRNPALQLRQGPLNSVTPQTKTDPQHPLNQAATTQPRHFKFAFMAAAVLAIVAAGIAVFLLMPKPPQKWAVVESHQPFISTPDVERFPSFSPDGTMIAYSRGKHAWDRQIFLQLRRGGDPIQLTHDRMDDVGPVFSPDGTSVAYSAGEAKQPCRIMLAQVPAGPSRQIGRCHMVERSSMAWDRGSHALFYSDRLNANEALHLLRYDVDTGARTEITRSGADGSLADFQPSVSPDGRTILFMRYVRGDRLQVVLHNLKTGAEHVLAGDLADKYAVWSDDASTVFVSRNLGSDSSLWAHPVSGAAPWRITSNSRPMEFLSSGPGGLLAVELKNKVTQLSVASGSSGAIPAPLDTNGFSGCSFDYARDGTFAIIANSGESPVIAVGAPGHLREILRLKQRVPCGIRWSPDGTRLAFGGGDAGSLISVIARTGMAVAQVPYPGEDFGYFEWTEDGKGFLQTRRDARGSRVWRVDIEPPYRAWPILPYGWDWVRVHNGMTFGTRDGSPGIWRIDGTPKRLTDWPSAERPWMWTVMGDKLVYADFADPEHPLIAAQPIKGGSRSIIGYADGMDTVGIFAADPHTGKITYNRVVRDDPDIGWLRLARK